MVLSFDTCIRDLPYIIKSPTSTSPYDARALNLTMRGFLSHRINTFWSDHPSLSGQRLMSKLYKTFVMIKRISWYAML